MTARKLLAVLIVVMWVTFAFMVYPRISGSATAPSSAVIVIMGASLLLLTITVLKGQEFKK